MMLTSSNVTMTTSTHHLQKNPVTISKNQDRGHKSIIEYWYTIFCIQHLGKAYTQFDLHTYIHVQTKTDTHLYTDTKQKNSLNSMALTAVQMAYLPVYIIYICIYIDIYTHTTEYYRYRQFVCVTDCK